MTLQLDAALAWLRNGVAPVPVRADGTKAPAVAWKTYTQQLPTEAEVRRWFNTDLTESWLVGVGVICGAVSGQLEMLELEGRAVDLLPELRAHFDDNGQSALWQRLQTYTQRSPSGGLHWFYRVHDAPARPNTKLARRGHAASETAIDVLAETRGEGGFVVVAPSGGTVHPTGKPWQILSGTAGTVAVVSGEERDLIHVLVAMLDEMPAVTVIDHPAKDRATESGRPGDVFNTEADWPSILEPHGWVPVFKFAGGTIAWRRPGKSQGISATTGRNDGDNLYVFTTSTVFEAEKPYSKFAAYALLEHRGDFSAAAKDLRARGYGSGPATGHPQGQNSPQLTHPPTSDGVPAADIPDPEPTWRPQDLAAILAGTYTPEEPILMPRSDGICLLYPGRVHSFHGESESGKSMVLQAETARLINDSQHVLYVDFESDAAAVIARLRELGATTKAIGKHFSYVRPDANPMTSLLEHEAFTQLLATTYTLAVVDGVTDALGVFGASSKDNDEVASFLRRVARRIAVDTGAAVAMIDHVAKDKDARGRFAIGGQAKMAGLDGAAYVVEVTEALGRGLKGVIDVRIAKDRPGGVRPHGGHFRKLDRTQLITRVVIDSTDDTAGAPIRVEWSAPTESVTDSNDGGWRFRPTHYMERVSRLLEVAPEPLSNSIIEDAITGKRDHIRTAIEALITEGYVGLSKGPRNANQHTSTKPYREDQDPRSDSYTDTDQRPRPDLAPTSPRRNQDDLAPDPPPLRGRGEVNGDQKTATSPPTSPPQPCTSCGTSVRPSTYAATGGLCGSCALVAP